MASYFSLFGHKRIWLVRSVEKYWARDTRTIKVRHSSQPFHFVVMTDPSPEESPTRYMLPDQVKGDGVVDYSLNEHSPARYPTFNKRKKSNKKKKAKKPNPGKSVQFRPTVTLKTIYQTLKSQIDDIDLANEEDYPSRVSAFALKRKGQKEILKYQHQYRPLTPRRLSMQKHIRETLQRENGNRSSSSSTPQTLPANSIQMNS